MPGRGRWEAEATQRYAWWETTLSLIETLKADRSDTARVSGRFGMPLRRATVTGGA